jgi:hypothetical protein
LRSLRFKKKFAAEKRRETHILSNQEQDIWIVDYVETETAGARKRVEDTEAAVQQEQDDMMHAEIARLTSREPKMMFEEMLVATGDTLCELATSTNRDDWKDQNDVETE